jgi:hypothetical protein
MSVYSWGKVLLVVRKGFSFYFLVHNSPSSYDPTPLFAFNVLKIVFFSSLYFHQQVFEPRSCWLNSEYRRIPLQHSALKVAPQIIKMNRGAFYGVIASLLWFRLHFPIWLILLILLVLYAIMGGYSYLNVVARTVKRDVT